MASMAKTCRKVDKNKEFIVFSFRCFPGVWFILADVSEHSICSIFKADNLEVIISKSSALKMEQIEFFETSANINQTQGKHSKENTLNTEHGERLKSRKIKKFLFCMTDYSNTLVLHVSYQRNSRIKVIPSYFALFFLPRV
jgi:hypothetical protein